MPFDPSSARLLTDETTERATTAAPASKVQDATLLDDVGKAVGTFAHSAVDTATFGLADKASALLAAGVSQATGAPMNYETALARVKDNVAKMNSASPIAAGLGTVAGLAGGGAAIAKGAQALTRVPGLVGRAATATGEALALRQGAPIANTAKVAAASGALAGADTALRGGNATEIGLSTGVGAVAGPVISKVAAVAVQKMQPAAKKAMQLLAKKIGEDADVLERASLNWAQAAGRPMTLAELTGMKTRGELRQLASNNPIIGDAAIGAKESTDAARAVSLPQRIEAITGQPPQDIAALVRAQTQTMNRAMDPIRTRDVVLDASHADMLLDRRVRRAVHSAENPRLLERYNAAVEGLEDGAGATLTVDDFDSIRRSIRSRQKMRANPNSKDPNSQAAQSLGELADEIGDVAGDQVSEYRAALTQFRADSNYIKGFKQSRGGGRLGEADNPELLRALQSAHGLEGFASGAQTRLTDAAAKSPAGAKAVAQDLSQPGDVLDSTVEALGGRQAQRLAEAGAVETQAARAMDTIAPSRPRPGHTEITPSEAAHLGAAATSGSVVSTVWHLMRSIPGLSKTLPAAQQRVVARYLLDPNMTRQGINLLRRAGLANQQIKDLQLAIGAATGVKTGETVSGN